MPATATVPESVLDLFDEPALGNVSFLNKRGQIVTLPMWVDFDGEHIVTSTPEGAPKLKSLREGAQVGVSIVSTKNPWHWLSASGHVNEIRPDENLAFIDKMSRKYTGQDYFRRTPRKVITIALERARSSESWG